MFGLPPSDVDECAADALLCGSNGVCNNTVGSYTCSCKDGYQMVDSTCTSEWLFWAWLF